MIPWSGGTIPNYVSPEGNDFPEELGEPLRFIPMLYFVGPRYGLEPLSENPEPQYGVRGFQESRTLEPWELHLGNWESQTF